MSEEFKLEIVNPDKSFLSKEPQHSPGLTSNLRLNLPSLTG